MDPATENPDRPRTPPPFFGGQGRTARSVRSDATSLVLTFLAAFAVIVALIVKEYCK